MVPPATLAAPIASPERAAGGIRPFGAADVATVAELWARCFPAEATAPAGLPAHLATVFLEHPWRDPELPSLVYEDARGTPIGFLGVIPRPMSLEGAPLRAAVSTRLMVHPEHRGAAALRLLQAFLRGPQDFSLADLGSTGSLALWERLGGTVAASYCLQWCRLLAPARAALAGLAFRRRSRTAAWLAGSLGRAADAALRALPAGPCVPRRSRLAAEVLSTNELLACLGASAGAYALAPAYTASSLAWLLGVLERKLSPLRRIRVHDAGAVIGWYVYGVTGHAGKVLRICAVRGRFGDVLEHLLDDAYAQGAALVTGRLEPRIGPELDDALYVVCRAPSVLVHSRSRRALEAVARGDAVLSRMEGEWWASP